MDSHKRAHKVPLHQNGLCNPCASRLRTRLRTSDRTRLRSSLRTSLVQGGRSFTAQAAPTPLVYYWPMAVYRGPMPLRHDNAAILPPNLLAPRGMRLCTVGPCRFGTTLLSILLLSILLSILRACQCPHRNALLPAHQVGSLPSNTHSTSQTLHF